MGGAVRGLPFKVKTEQSTRKIGKKYARTQNCEIKNAYRSAQMKRHFKQAPFVETKSKERPCHIMTLYLTSTVWNAIAVLCCLKSFTSYDILFGYVVLILPNVVWI